uniref:Uncharacterized protein n=1 Tax=Chrysotila carterae TaxID=13221 RepID=A0A7S4B755_CHRCT|mmetsp:Transcript_6055/g.13249  ORF Transcript_6055/g.13249 Transcript_6055/m.13249 type:complete len:110 (-) Transcript_6055:155-484(-)
MQSQKRAGDCLCTFDLSEDGSLPAGPVLGVPNWNLKFPSRVSPAQPHVLPSKHAVIRIEVCIGEMLFTKKLPTFLLHKRLQIFDSAHNKFSLHLYCSRLHLHTEGSALL